MEKKSRLSEIFEFEKKKGKGTLGALGGALTGRALEKLDIRNVLFGSSQQKSSLAQSIGRSIFGSGYSAAPIASRMIDKSVSGEIDGKATELLNSIDSRMNSVDKKMTLLVKNSIGQNRMSRDINVIRQNVVLLTKKQLGTARTSADMYFMRSKQRETEYERQFKKEKGVEGSAVGSSTGSGAAPKGLKGIGLDLLGSLAGAVGTGVSIAAIGAGIGGFITGIAAGGAAAEALGGGEGIKNLLVNLGEGLNSFSGEGLLALGALLAPGMLFGAISGPGKALKRGGGAAIGMTMIGTGIGGFLAGLSAGGKLSEMIGSAQGIRDLLLAVGEGLGAFSEQSLVALATALAPGMLFGAVAGPGGAATAGVGAGIGMTLIGAGIGGFLLALSGAARIIEEFGGSESLKTFLINFAEGLNPLGQIDGTNVLKIAAALPVLGTSMLAFWGAKGLGGVLDTIQQSGEKALKFFGFESDGKETKEKTIFEKIAESLKPLEKVNGNNLSKVGQGIKDLATGMLRLSKINNEGLMRAETASIAAADMAMMNSQTSAPKFNNSYQPSTNIGTNPSNIGMNTSSPTNSPQAIGGASLLSSSPQKMSGDKFGNPIADLIYQRFLSAGFTHEQALAAVANAKKESAFIPTAMGDNNNSIGLFQFNFKAGAGKGYLGKTLDVNGTAVQVPEDVERAKELFKNPEVNIAAMIGLGKSTGLQKTSNLQDANQHFVTKMERPANQAREISDRLAIAESLQSGKPLSTSSTPSYQTPSVPSMSGMLAAAESGVDNLGSIMMNFLGGSNEQGAGREVADAQQNIMDSMGAIDINALKDVMNPILMSTTLSYMG